MNNKGQSLVIFVLVLPLIMFIIAGIVEIGRLSIVKAEYEGSITDAINYGLDNLDRDDVKEKIGQLINSNIKGTVEVEVSNENIEVHVTNSLEGLFSKLFKSYYDINLTYKGYISNGEKKIIKD